ncbi:MAG TPA: hypothetical protein VM431_10975 [Phycisphaerae bacterium]|nr:hypothetical protein [Phycisphaerae bacterium]
MHRNTTSRFGLFLTAGLVAGTRVRTLCVVAALALAGQAVGLGCAQARAAEIIVTLNGKPSLSWKGLQTALTPNEH